MNKRCHTALRPLLNGICRNSLVTWPRPPRVPSFCSCQQQVRLPRSRSAVPFENYKGTEISQQSAMHNVLTRINNLSALLSSCLMGLVAVIALSSVLLEANMAPPKGSVSILAIKSSVSSPYSRLYRSAFLPCRSCAVSSYEGPLQGPRTSACAIRT